MRILVTGATGFLGNALTNALIADDHKLAAIVRPTSDTTQLSKKSDLLALYSVQHRRDIYKAIENFRPQAVFHTACAYGRNGENPVEMHETNVTFGLDILQALSDTEIAAYMINVGTVLESTVNMYALTKNHFSEAGKMIAAQSNHGLKFINLKLQHMYGPGDSKTKFFTYVLHSCQSNQPKIDLTDGTQNRDFVYIRDVVLACLHILTVRTQIGVAEDLDIGTGNAPELRAVVKLIHSLTHSSTELRFGAIPMRDGEMSLCKADISRMLELGWQPQYDLVKGLQETIDIEFNT